MKNGDGSQNLHLAYAPNQAGLNLPHCHMERKYSKHILQLISSVFWRYLDFSNLFLSYPISPVSCQKPLTSADGQQKKTRQSGEKNPWKEWWCL